MSGDRRGPSGDIWLYQMHGRAVDDYGRKELLAMTDGFRESTQSWREVFATTQEQRCWVHKTMNVLNALPKSIQAKAKAHPHDIWQAETKAKANNAFDFFTAPYGVKMGQGGGQAGQGQGRAADLL